MKSRGNARMRTNGRRAIVFAGGVIVALTCSTLAKAQEGGLFDFLRRSFGQSAPVPIYRPSPGSGWSPQRSYRDTVDHSRSFRRQAVRQRVRARIAASKMGGGMTVLPRVTGNRTLCVRTCDGFAFPIGRLSRTIDLPVHEAACQAACPATATQLYTMGRGVNEGDPARARSVKDGSLYRELASAFLYRTKLAGSCNCQGPDNLSKPLPIAEDRTLRRGDVVVDARGVGKVFEGDGDAPHATAKFTEFRRSAALGAVQRKQVDRLLDVSRREAMARDFERKLRVRQAGLQEVQAPAGSAVGVQAFRVVTASASGYAAAIRQVAPTIVVIR